MAPSAKRVTSQDVAAAAGVSRTTVSFVLNNRPGQVIPEETRQRVLDAARRLDYRPNAAARALAAGRSNIVLLSIPDLPVGPSITRFVEELAAALAEHDLTLVTHLAAARGRPLADVCANIDASAVVGLTPFDSATVQSLYRSGARVVVPPEGADEGPTLGRIGGIQAEHLIERGHRRLGFALPAQPNLRRMAEDRLRGATEACVAARIDPPLAIDIGQDVPDAADAVAAWTARSVTGICAFNDETAVAVLAGMGVHRLRAPADLAVVGADDIPTARLMTPPLTTVVFDLHEVGRHRAEDIAARLAGREAETPPPVTPQLIVRAST